MKGELRVPDSESTFGMALRWAREQRGVTLRQLGALVGVSAPFLSDVEHDRRQVQNVAAYAEALTVSLADLERRQGITRDLTDWLSKKPKLLMLLRDIRGNRVRPLVLDKYYVQDPHVSRARKAELNPPTTKRGRNRKA